MNVKCMIEQLERIAKEDQDGRIEIERNRNGWIVYLGGQRHQIFSKTFEEAVTSSLEREKVRLEKSFEKAGRLLKDIDRRVGAAKFLKRPETQ